MQEYNPIQLSTKIKDLNQQIICPYISLIKSENYFQAHLYVYLANTGIFQIIGNMTYIISSERDHLYIYYMESSLLHYHNVGTALHEHAFRESIKAGKNGRIHLQAYKSSHYFHFLNGFRPCPEEDEYEDREIWLKKFLGLPQANGRVDSSSIGCRSMYLPDATIEEKKIFFNINDKPHNTTVSQFSSLKFTEITRTLVSAKIQSQLSPKDSLSIVNITQQL